ncbi:hypothetical protein L873DRAFT_1805523 [Choiromyces venosus 120613-1]|uniref:MaoC-like domain-containing protein n=1 Tax=Choiromyces venosus 120613-1 TaxID=1336337 RepID=A0A3N4JSW3_9PEZI|nr:hypothetical protein L873DRAFT_1805523 [Choiromyces venosus 120613-1]
MITPASARALARTHLGPRNAALDFDLTTLRFTSSKLPTMFLRSFNPAAKPQSRMPPRLHPRALSAQLYRHPLITRPLTTTSAAFPPPLAPTEDFISPTPTHLLDIALSPYLNTTLPSVLPKSPKPLPPGHHLVYFPPPIPESQLLQDGSDAQHSPTPLLPRRMWAGGSLAFNSPVETFTHALLREEITNVADRNGKTFVSFDRYIYPDGTSAEAAIVEKRDLVFLPPATTPPPPRKRNRPPEEPDFAREFSTTQHLLFRFSALTYNAHRIHYDPEFAAGVEFHVGPLVHGPLSVVFLLELLRAERKGRVKGFVYRCLAPVVVGEEYKICGKLKSRGEVEGRMEAVYSLWSETKSGYAVMGTATVVED